MRLRPARRFAGLRGWVHTLIFFALPRAHVFCIEPSLLVRWLMVSWVAEALVGGDRASLKRTSESLSSKNRTSRIDKA